MRHIRPRSRNWSTLRIVTRSPRIGATAPPRHPTYGAEPSRTFYTLISDQYAHFSSKVVNVGVRDATYVLDGLLYHESDLRITEHYTETARFTDHIFALMRLLGFIFAPRIRYLGET